MLRSSSRAIETVTGVCQLWKRRERDRSTRSWSRSTDHIQSPYRSSPKPAAKLVLRPRRAQATARFAMPPGEDPIPAVHTSVPGSGGCGNPVKIRSKNTVPVSSTSTSGCCSGALVMVIPQCPTTGHGTRSEPPGQGSTSAVACTVPRRDGVHRAVTPSALDSRLPRMVRIGYAAALEQLPPLDALDAAVRAEQHGFTGVMASDVLAPWVPAQGQAPFVWNVLTALAERTRGDIGPGVAVPTFRW